VSLGAIRDVEQGRVRRPHPEPAARIAEVLGVNAADWAPAEVPDVRASGLWIGVLGSLVLGRNGSICRALPAGQRVTLGLLALAGGAPVRLETIIGALWAQDAPRSAVSIVHTYISRLRSVLDCGDGDGRQRLTRDGAGYRLLLAEDELDLQSFRWLTLEARKFRAAGDADRASMSYAAALGLWRGEPLADIDVLRGHPAVVALAEEHSAGVIEYADVAAECGRQEDVLPHLRALAAGSPLDETVHSQLMLMLAGSGRQAESIAIFTELRRRLDEELGVLPGPEIRAAHASILRQDVRFRGVSVTADDSWAPVYQLPAAVADFTGRKAESARLAAAITPRADQVGVPLVAVSGPPGVGKTSLALHVAHTVRAQFPDGQLWVHLAGTSARPRDAGEILGEFLRSLGVHGSAIPHDLPERAARYRSCLAGRRILVVADDALDADQVRPLLPGTTGCALLVTSRSRLEGFDGARPIPLDMMTAQDAADLLSRIVGDGRVAAEKDAADSLIQVCGSLPLALRIVGAKLAGRPAWSLSLLTRRINGAHARLRELESGNLSVRASIESSYYSLSAPARRAFRLLALLGSADFAGWTVAALLGEPDPADVIGELEDRSLLTPVGADMTGEPRHRLHDLLREYAAERLAAEDGIVARDALQRLLHGWLQLTMLANAGLPAGPYFPLPARIAVPDVVPDDVAGRLTSEPIAWFCVERISLLSVVEQACQAGRLDLAHQIASHQCAFQHLQYRQDDSERLWAAIERAADSPRDAALARYARLRIAATLVQRGRIVEAFPLLGESVAEADRSGELELLAYALEWHATCAADLEEYSLARASHERGVAVARKVGSLHAEHRNLGQLAVACAWLGQRDEAVAMSARGAEIASELGVPAYRLSALHAAGHVYSLVGLHERAVSACLEAVDLAGALGDVFGQALALGMLGDAFHGLGRYAEAADSLRTALAVFRQHSNRRFYALCLLKLGYADEAMGSPEAVGHLEESLRLFEELRLLPKADAARQALHRTRKVTSE
jgi:DNA-binding SARP family transcriptional activator/tetratricopeptide (TPR) repeat protein